MMPTLSLDDILKQLKKVKPAGAGKYSARCPSHKDTNSSLSVTSKHAKVLLHCFAGCSQPDVWGALGVDLNGNSKRTARTMKQKHISRPEANANVPTHGCTLAEYAAFKGLLAEKLKEYALADQLVQVGKGANACQRSVVAIPYLDKDRRTLAVQYRHALTGDNKFTWRKGDKPVLYGLWHLAEWADRKSIVLVEGASDCHTLWTHGTAALGLPGAKTWKEEFATYLDPFEEVYLVVEPDNGGKNLCETLGKSGIRDKLRLVSLPAKDASELHLSRSENFDELLNAAFKNAVPFSEHEQKQLAAEREQLLSQCSDLASVPDILARVADVSLQLGVAGEEKAVKIIFLTLVSRLFDRPVSLAVKGPSSSGKSFTVEQTLRLFPASAYFALSAMSERFLAYTEESFEHRYLVLYEAPGMGAEMSNYLIRSLLSEGHIKYGTVEKANGLRGRVLERPGPTGLIVTTTETDLHPENETRMLSVEVNDTPEQTRRVLDRLASMQDSEATTVAFEKWKALQQWLESGVHAVVVPYSRVLAANIPVHATRIRRDFTALLTLIKAHALLHQQNRETDRNGYVVANLDDYAAVRELVIEIIGEAVQSTVSEATRGAVEAVKELTPGLTTTTFAAVAQHLKLEVSAARRRVQKAISKGFVKNLESRPHQPAQLTLDADVPLDTPALPPVGLVRERWHSMASVGFGPNQRNGVENKGVNPHVGTLAQVSAVDITEDQEFERLEREALQTEHLYQGEISL